MAQGESKFTHQNTSLFFRILSLVKIFLVQVGRLPLVLLVGAWHVFDGFLDLIVLGLRFIVKHPVRFKSPKPNRQLRKIRLFFKKRIPRKVKLISAVAVFIIFLSVYTFLTVQTAHILPSPDRLSATERPLTTEFFDRNGKLLYRLYEGRNRSLIKIDELPPYLVNATIAIEDKNFYKHKGIDLLAIVRAIRHNLSTNDVQGASTITQQLIKNTLLTPERSYSRKIKEVILSFWTEMIYSKRDILQMYFNEAPYGGPAWGIEAGALTYFGKDAKDLSLAEATFLAGLPASPTEYSPFGQNPNAGKIRQKQVLTRMVEDGYIDHNQADTALAEPLKLLPSSNGLLAPHFVMYVKNLLGQKYGARVVSQGGLKIYTTLDLNLQNKTQEIVKTEVNKIANLSVGNGAAMVLDGKTGQILAMVGSKDYHQLGYGNYNVATEALRQPGSSIKPITYATALKQGFTPATIVLDVPVKFPDGYSPVNYDGRFHGPVTIRTALGSSYNIPAVKVLDAVGVDKMLQTAHDMGITTLNDPSNYGLSLTLGGGEVRLIDMMAVYDTLSQNGNYQKPTPILKVLDSEGNVIEEYENSPKPVLQSEIAYLITNILSDNNARTPAFGPNSLLNIPGQTVAVKTGTSDNKKDNWTFGYTPSYVVGVWVGNNDNSPMNPSLTSGVTGAAPIWNKIMAGLLKDQKSVAFNRPTGIIEATVNFRKDLVITGILPKQLVRISQKDNQTIFSDGFSTFATPSAQISPTP